MMYVVEVCTRTMYIYAHTNVKMKQKDIVTKVTFTHFHGTHVHRICSAYTTYVILTLLNSDIYKLPAHSYM